MLTAAVIVLGATFTILQAFEKWGWLDLYEVVRKKWMPEGLCYLCMSFWLSMPVCGLYYALYLFNLHYILIPFTVAGLINWLTTTLKK